MRLSVAFINDSSHGYFNPLKERELDLRGHKIPAIENLGSAVDQESIDFTDNDLALLANFPHLPRLQTLLCAQNRIATIAASVPNSLPNLTTLVLAQNNLRELADLDALQGFRKLTHLTLIGNPVTSKEFYRYWVVWRCPQVRFFDFQKVKDSERSKAIELFGKQDSPSELALSVISRRSNQASALTSSATTNGTGKTGSLKVTEQEKKRFQALVRNARTLAEVQRLEKAFNEGRLPAGVMDGDTMDET